MPDYRFTLIVAAPPMSHEEILMSRTPWGKPAGAGQGKPLKSLAEGVDLHFQDAHLLVFHIDRGGIQLHEAGKKWFPAGPR